MNNYCFTNDRDLMVDIHPLTLCSDVDCKDGKYVHTFNITLPLTARSINSILDTLSTVRGVFYNFSGKFLCYIMDQYTAYDVSFLGLETSSVMPSCGIGKFQFKLNSDAKFLDWESVENAKND